MKKWKFLWVVFLFCYIANATALNRDFWSEEYCREHCDEYCKPYEKQWDKYDTLKEYLPLIPEVSSRCMHMDCSKCNDAWAYEYWEYNDEDGSDTCTGYHWSCDCMEADPDIDPETWLDSWKCCEKRSVYPGYFLGDHNKYFSLFNAYLKHMDAHRECNCFWPEISKKAANINDKAYRLFKELFSETDLEVLVWNSKEQAKFFYKKHGSPDLHRVAISCVCHCFFYSDYDWVCRDLDVYSKSYFETEIAVQISGQLQEIRETLAEMFLGLYKECEQKHPNQKIKNELLFVRKALGFSESEAIQRERHFSLPQEELYAAVTPSLPVSWEMSEICLLHGTDFNDVNAYNQSIDWLTKAIEHNPENDKAYIERAFAYFETNQIDLALKDYTSAKQLKTVPPLKINSFCSLLYAPQLGAVYIPKNKLEFSQGLVEGTVAGGAISVVEFIPSNLSCCRGILNGLWAFACAPKEVSIELLYAAYAIGEFVSSHTTEECLHCVVPELKELSETWDTLNDYMRGKKIGYIIGKYGVDIFLPTAILKGVVKLRTLKRANTMMTLEGCTLSTAHKSTVVEQSGKRAAHTATVLETAKSGKILVKNSNVQYHVMQKKHAWDKVITLTGDVEKDFNAVLLFLEENGVFAEENLYKSLNFPEITKLEYRKVVNGHTVQAVFEKAHESQQSFLYNGWVVTE